MNLEEAVQTSLIRQNAAVLRWGEQGVGVEWVDEGHSIFVQWACRRKDDAGSAENEVLQFQVGMPLELEPSLRPVVEGSGFTTPPEHFDRTLVFSLDDDRLLNLETEAALRAAVLEVSRKLGARDGLDYEAFPDV